MIRSRGDQGSSLILVLVLITVVALGLTGLLSLSDASLRATLGLRARAAASDNADAAAQAAITTIRNSGYNAAPGQHCFGSADTLSVPNADGTTATVTCAADPAKVIIQCPSLSQCNRPGSAILTLGRIPGEDGLNIQQPNSGSAFRVHGLVFSNSTINVVNGSLTTNSRVYARGDCTGTIQSVPMPPSCDYGTTANVLGDDPAYPAATGTVPTYQPLPACTAANSVVTFSPGYYDDAAGLSAMMTSSSRCKHSVWWFRPGTYYFDFHNDSGRPNANPVLGGGTDVWTVDDGYLVAGTPTNAAGALQATPSVPAAIPGACDNPINDAHAQGVQFIFGGDSQLQVKAGQVEICGTYSASRPPVAVYGLTTGTDAQAATTTTLNAVAAPGPFGSTATVANLVNADSTRYASWTSGKRNDSATMTVGGYATAAIPAGSVLTSATVRVVHRHSDTSTADSLGVSLTPTGGTAMTGSVTGHKGSGAWSTDTVTLDRGSGALAQAVHAGTFTGAQIALTANLTNRNDTEDVDTVALDLTYVAPAWRAAGGCVSAGPYTGTGSSACAMVSSVGTSGNQFYVQGTTYVPGGVVDVTLNNAAEQIFRFGVIARSVWVKETGSFTYTGPVIEVPDDSPGFALSVYLNVCPPGVSACPTGGASTPVLRAKVAFVDADPTNPVPGQRQVAVLSWTRPG